ncbi:MAG: AAA family ATPase [Epulopiscium sp. Nele67-Bin004]|nr:MAG: AAA family ATPase [Epulopiscium sp. Nele67-Bin004]
MFLNTKASYNNFLELYQSKTYVDKSMIIELLNERISTIRKFVCITRPRRFGKSQITFLLESYYSKAFDTKGIFDNLKVSNTPSYRQHLNKYNVVKIDFSQVGQYATYEEYINKIKSNLNFDIDTHYSQVDLTRYDQVQDKFEAIQEETGDKFIFIFDEWDFIFNRGLYINEHQEFLEFLRQLLKDRSYVALCYMTGILPIKQHSTGSALNMFSEYTFLKDTVLDKFCGFTEEEVQQLCEQNNGISYEELSYWYNGYITASGARIFNPRSVVEALSNNNCQSYWTNTGAFNEVLSYLKLDAFGVRDDVIKMINGEHVPIKILQEFRAGSAIPRTKEEIYSAMITWGFLSYYNEEVCIPNNELMLEFVIALRDESFGEVSGLLKNSDEMLRATLAKDNKKVAQIVHDIHNSEIPVLKYTDENSTSCVLTLAYLSARDRYRIEREEKSGKGFVDFVFHPRNSRDLPIVVELKRNSTLKTALNQVMEREYVEKFMKLYKKDVLVVVINYSDKRKTHTCKIVQVEYEE